MGFEEQGAWNEGCTGDLEGKPGFSTALVSCGTYTVSAEHLAPAMPRSSVRCHRRSHS